MASFAALSPAADLGARTITFSKDVAPILQEKCQVCHREGSMAPMSLMTYEQTRPWAKAIRQRVITRQMPPWHLDKTVGVQKFKNDISLSDDQIATIVQWVDAGAPQGDPKDMPAPKQWPRDDEWQAAKELGQPDLVVKADPYTMPARHQDVWWRPEATIPINEPRWVRAVEVRPTNPSARKIVHHAVAYLVQNDGDAPSAAANDADRQGVLMEWAIGKSYDFYRPDTGKLLLPGSKISWDIHIHAAGEELVAGVELGVWLYKKGQDPKYRTHLTAFPGKTGPNLDIPPNSLVESQGFTVLKQAAILENIQPHMHLRGKAMSLEAILPDGTSQMVSYVGNFNFNWMTNYIYDDDAAPVLPKGTVIKVTTWHDNTKDNPFNPDPDQWVGFGHRTVDEMAHAWVNVTYISDEDYSAWAAKHKKTVAVNAR
ncbi:MAG: cytochrome c [Bryobacterales bacterium]|nr:cytochrome c [Bryobacterales bacterium]MBV9401720.1 cytochrome c [Bryobacterales bacterium]